MERQIPEVVVSRLPIYVRALTELHKEGITLVALLLRELSQILGLDRQWRMAVVGVGRLGRAIMDYKGFVPRGFKIVAAFDKNRSAVGRKVSGVTVQDMAKLEATVRERKVDIAIVAVPSSEAQGVIDKLVQSGVRSILNYAPICGKVPRGCGWRGLTRCWLYRA